MRTIRQSGQFKRDYRRAKKGRHGKILDAELMSGLRLLQSDAALAPRHRDHGLTGDWLGFRDCHVRPDLVLIYQKAGDDALLLARLGLHSELGW